MNFLHRTNAFLKHQKSHLAVSETLYCDFLWSRDPRFLRVLLILRVFPTNTFKRRSGKTSWKRRNDTRLVGNHSERTFVIITIDRWSLGPIRVLQEVGRSDQGSGCPFPFWGGPFRCNGQLKTIQTEDTTGSFDELPSLPFFSWPSVFSSKSSAWRIESFVRILNYRWPN